MGAGPAPLSSLQRTSSKDRSVGRRLELLAELASTSSRVPGAQLFSPLKDTRITYPEPGVGQLPAIDNFWASERRLVTTICVKEPRRLTRTAQVEAGVREVGQIRRRDMNRSTLAVAVALTLPCWPRARVQRGTCSPLSLRLWPSRPCKLEGGTERQSSPADCPR